MGAIVEIITTDWFRIVCQIQQLYKSIAVVFRLECCSLIDPSGKAVVPLVDRKGMASVAHTDMIPVFKRCRLLNCELPTNTVLLDE